MTKFVCFTNIETAKPVAVNPSHVAFVFPSKIWYDTDNKMHEDSHTELGMATRCNIHVQESYEEVLEAFRRAEIYIGKVGNNG